MSSNSHFDRGSDPDIVITEADMDEAARQAVQVRDFLTNPVRPLVPVARVISRCVKTQQDYHLLFEVTGEKTWAIRRSSTDASRVDNAAPGQPPQADLVSGSIDWTDLYSGLAACPYCQAKSLVRCGACRCLSCHPDGNQGSEFLCPWCGNTGRLADTIKALDGQWGKGKGS